MLLQIREENYEKILNHAKLGYPNEACGLIAGYEEVDKKIIEKVYLLTNLDASPEHFSIDPKEQLQAIRDVRESGLVPLGNFHSHPNTPSRPSEEDIRLAYNPLASYLILSLAEEKHPVLRSFHIDKGLVEEESIEII